MLSFGLILRYGAEAFAADGSHIMLKISMYYISSPKFQNETRISGVFCYRRYSEVSVREEYSNNEDNSGHLIAETTNFEKLSKWSELRKMCAYYHSWRSSTTDYPAQISSLIG